MTAGWKEYDVTADLTDLISLFNCDTWHDKNTLPINPVKAC